MTDFHPYEKGASHIPSDYRDGWNECYEVAKARIAELEKDAARYQWLRDYSFSSDRNHHNDPIHTHSPLEFDCAIIAAMSKETSEHPLAAVVQEGQARGDYDGPKEKAK